MKLSPTVALVVCVVALLGSAGHTAEEPSPEASMSVFSESGMEGLREVRVVVAEIDDRLEHRLNMSDQKVMCCVERYLREIPGLTVSDSSSAYVYVAITGFAHDGPTGHVRLDLVQRAYVHRSHPGSGEKVLVVPAATWSGGRVFTQPGMVGNTMMMVALRTTLDEFQNEYLKANPDVKA
jgi:hypothetical protein